MILLESIERLAEKATGWGRKADSLVRILKPQTT